MRSSAGAVKGKLQYLAPEYAGLTVTGGIWVALDSATGEILCASARDTSAQSHGPVDCCQRRGVPRLVGASDRRRSAVAPLTAQIAGSPERPHQGPPRVSLLPRLRSTCFREEGGRGCVRRHRNSRRAVRHWDRPMPWDLLLPIARPTCCRLLRRAIQHDSTTARESHGRARRSTDEDDRSRAARTSVQRVRDPLRAIDQGTLLIISRFGELLRRPLSAAGRGRS